MKGTTMNEYVACLNYEGRSYTIQSYGKSPEALRRKARMTILSQHPNADLGSISLDDVLVLLVKEKNAQGEATLATSLCGSTIVEFEESSSSPHQGRQRLIGHDKQRNKRACRPGRHSYKRACRTGRHSYKRGKVAARSLV